MNTTEARKRVVQTYHQTSNYCQTARRGHTSPNSCASGCDAPYNTAKLVRDYWKEVGLVELLQLCAWAFRVWKGGSDAVGLLSGVGVEGFGVCGVDAGGVMR
jgi:hypothetical protein